MAKLKLTGKELRKIGYPEGPVISLAMNIMEKSFKHLSKEDALEILGSILQSPNQYAHDGVLDKIAEALLPKAPPSEGFGELSNWLKKELSFLFSAPKELSKVPCIKCTRQPNYR